MKRREELLFFWRLSTATKRCLCKWPPSPGLGDHRKSEINSRSEAKPLLKSVFDIETDGGASGVLCEQQASVED